jgi:murein DD-endopeptidase MepM/ murein hydrolase activator NlpD
MEEKNMSREERKIRKHNKQVSLKNKYIIYWLAILGIAIVVLLAYALNTSNEKEEKSSTGNISDFIIAEEDESTESASSNMGNTLEETKNNANESQTTEKEQSQATNSSDTEDAENQVTDSNEKQNEESQTTSSNETKSGEEQATNNSKEKTTSSDETKNDENQIEQNSENQTETNAEVVKKEVEFSKPVEGSIIKEFAKDNLVYSETLKEWITHNGIDISASKTTVVKASADGTVKSIKNDPRYGLTVIISHDDNYETVYSNLLTAEFIVEGETLKVGQSIGTVGNSASFESSDEAHLHFEIIKNGEYVDPNIYVNYSTVQN